MKNILIGTMSKANANTPDYIRQLGKLGFECTEVTFGHDCKWLMSGIDTDAFAADCKKALDEYGMEMSALGVYGNPLESDEDAVLCRKLNTCTIHNRHLRTCMQRQVRYDFAGKRQQSDIMN